MFYISYSIASALPGPLYFNYPYDKILFLQDRLVFTIGRPKLRYLRKKLVKTKTELNDKVILFETKNIEELSLICYKAQSVPTILLLLEHFKFKTIELGIEYFFKAMDASGNTDSTNIGYTYWSYSPKDFQAVNSKSFNGTAESYKIISNPYLLESDKATKLFADFGSF